LIAEPEQNAPAATAATTRVRMRFAKRGDLRLISHHDLMRCLERVLRRAGLPMAHSQGFNPRPKAVFPLALGLGIEGCREVLELDLVEPLAGEEVLHRLAAQAPPGLVFLEAEAVRLGRAPKVEALLYTLAVPASRRDAARAAVHDLLAAETRYYTRRRPDRPAAEFDLRPFVLSAAVDADGTLTLRLKMTPNGSARPEEVLDTLGLHDLLEHGGILARTDVFLAPASDHNPH
jgi:radical SAM-linked protein